MLTPDEAGAELAGPSPWASAARALSKDRSAAAGAAVLLLLATMAALAPYVAPHSPTVQPDIIGLKLAPPSLTYPFGTDEASRDVLSRLIFGARVSLSVAFLSVAVSATIGTAYGALAGYANGALDSMMMRVVDALLAIPRVLLLIAVATLWYPLSLPGLILLLGLTGWFGVSRLVRSMVVAAREDEFVTAARALGASDRRILVHHILPQVVSPVLVAATLGIGNVVVIEAGLTAFNMGVRPPNASWGSVFFDGIGAVRTAWWISTFAGLALIVTVLAVNLVADGLRRALSGRQLPAR